MSLIDWFQGHKSKGAPWPKLEDETAEKPAFLVHLREADLEGEIVVNLLLSAQIPVKLRYPNDGSFGRVVMGISGTGIDVYVPESYFEEAQALLAADFEEMEFDHEKS